MQSSGPPHIYHNNNTIFPVGTSSSNPGIPPVDQKLEPTVQINPSSTTCTVSEGMPPNKKRKRRYLAVVFRIFITLAIIAGIVVLLKSFEQKGSLTKAQKYSFNTVMILLTLILALNMTVAHSQIVLLIREGIINKHPRDGKYWTFRQERRFNKITGLRTSLSFMLEELRPPAGKTSHEGSISVASIFVAVWLLFNLSVAVAIALVGLTYSLEEGGIGKKTGFVSIVDTTHFYYDSNNKETPDVISERFVSKLYADISISYPNTTAKNPSPASQYDLEQGEGGWVYNFREYNPDRTVAVRSDRYITTNAVCRAFKVKSFDTETFTLTWMEDGKEQSIAGISMGPRSTTYMSTITDIHSLAISGCGARCGMIVVAQLDLSTNFNNDWLYGCRSTVDEVYGGTLPEHEISDAQAIIAATSLTQSGLFDDNLRSFSYYPHKVRWGEPANGDPEKMANILARASAGCIAAMDEINPRILVPGQEPWQGVELRVRWPRLIAVLVVIGFLQMVTAFTSIWWHVKNWSTSDDATANGVSAGAASGPGLQPNYSTPPPLHSPGSGYPPSYPQSPVQSPVAWGHNGSVFQPPIPSHSPATTANTGYFHP